MASSNSKVVQQFRDSEMVTHDNAQLLGMSGARNPYPGTLGVIEEGAFADMLVIDGNPLEDISLIEHPETAFKVIVKDGSIVKTRSGHRRAHDMQHGHAGIRRP